MNNIGRTGFDELESNEIQHLLDSQDKDLTVTDRQEMLEAYSTEKHPTHWLKKNWEKVTKDYELRDRFTKIDQFLERIVLSKGKYVHGTAEYYFELKVPLKVAQQEKITKIMRMMMIVIKVMLLNF